MAEDSERVWQRDSLSDMLREYVHCSRFDLYEDMRAIEKEIELKISESYTAGLSHGVMVSAIPVNDNEYWIKGYNAGFTDGDNTDIPPGNIGEDFSDE